MDVSASGVRFPDNVHGGSNTEQARIYVEAGAGNGDTTNLVIQNENDGPGDHEDNIHLKAAKVYIKPNAASGYAGGGQLIVEGGCTGCTVAPSDRGLKTGFAAVDTRSILDSLARLPIQRWSYKSDSNATQHLGPMAQDFSAAFSLGRDDKHIDLIDASGVTMASVQALYQMMLEKDRQIQQLQAELNQVKRAIRRGRAARRR